MSAHNKDHVVLIRTGDTKASYARGYAYAFDGNLSEFRKLFNSEGNHQKRYGIRRFNKPVLDDQHVRHSAGTPICYERFIGVGKPGFFRGENWLAVAIRHDKDLKHWLWVFNRTVARNENPLVATSCGQSVRNWHESADRKFENAIRYTHNESQSENTDIKNAAQIKDHFYRICASGVDVNFILYPDSVEPLLLSASTKISQVLWKNKMATRMDVPDALPDETQSGLTPEQQEIVDAISMTHLPPVRKHGLADMITMHGSDLQMFDFKTLEDRTAALISGTDIHKQFENYLKEIRNVSNNKQNRIEFTETTIIDGVRADEMSLDEFLAKRAEVKHRIAELESTGSASGTIKTLVAGLNKDLEKLDNLIDKYIGADSEKKES
jgi:hypothetical protein